MKVLLVFPPQFTPFRPYVAGPSLVAYLRGKGIDAIQKDVNLEVYETFLSESYIKGIKPGIDARFAALETKDRLNPGDEQKRYNNLFVARSIAANIAENIQTAKKVFHSPETFFDPDELARARETINLAFSVISTAHLPTSFSFAPFEMPSFTGSFDSLEKVTTDRSENPFIEYYDSHLMPFIEEQKPDVIGITIASHSQLVPALTLSRMLKTRANKAHITVGGHVSTVLSEVISRHTELFRDFFDSVILNEGELPLLRLVECLSKGESLQTVPNLMYLSDGAVQITEMLPPVDINDLPTPCFDGLDLDSYFGPEPVVPLLSSRGCYWNKCAFCGHGLGWGGAYQLRDTQKVIDDVQTLSHKHGARHFAFCDEGISPHSIRNLSDKIIERGLDIRCSTNIRLEKQFTQELCQKIARAGFRMLSLGLESSCDRVLNLMSKGTTEAVATEVCRNVYDAGIWNHVYFMLGFPGETYNEAKQTIDFLAGGRGFIRSFYVENFGLGKGSIIYKHPEDFGITVTNDGPENEFLLVSDYTVSSGLTYDQARELAQYCMTTVADSYDSTRLLDSIGYRYDKDFALPLYLCRFEESDPLLKSLTAKLNAPHAAATAVRLNRRSTPSLRNGVVFDNTNFNLAEVRQNLAADTKLPVYPVRTQVLVDTHSGNLAALPEAGMELVRLCDGRSTLKQIVQTLAEKYQARFESIEQDCITFLEAIAQQGFVEIPVR
ncbi:PqqD family peptide modification chaperone [Dehalogenimonas etheniformans]|uniref:Radical SAM protein n=1 Tax=Dehalogenimonas etheniformans TaxID=1536648 RepID=A0A2P5P8G7_9CHLR|nr:PqqD family peptide modification chaperone [Dehalogenimonas etheniformans]PPD58587.1 radical SAM protein [Dehalogenimonas etheniformans]QNT76648.1 radical SAM protein [Dehalogenimonas etheniformans]